jgi:hypothetical protein
MMPNQTAHAVSYRDDILNTFERKLKSWRKKTEDHVEFYNVHALQAWMLEIEPGESTNNTELLLYKIRHEIGEHGTFLPRVEDITGRQGEAPKVLVFATLLQQKLGHLIDIFRGGYIDDTNMMDFSKYRDELRNELRRCFPEPDEIIAKFEKARWAFYPVELRIDLRDLVEHERILPFAKRVPVNGKGGTATVFQVAVWQDLLRDELRQILQPALYEDAVYGPVRFKSIKNDIHCYPNPSTVLPPCLESLSPRKRG